MRENNRLLTAIGVVPETVQRFIAGIEQWGGSPKVCGAGSVTGQKGGIVVADEMPKPLMNALKAER